MRDEKKTTPKIVRLFVLVVYFVMNTKQPILWINETKRHLASVDIRQLQYHQVVYDSQSK